MHIDLDMLDACEELTGYIPDQWRAYLDWVLVNDPTSQAAEELRRLMKETLH